MTAIGDARPEDTAEILELLQRCHLPLTGVAENPLGFLVARQAEKLVGCCGLEIYGTDGLLRSLAVEQRFRGRGLGRDLVSAIIVRAKAGGLSSLYLLTQSASGFFSRFGFEARARFDATPEIRDSWEFSSGCPETARLMWRPLTTSSPLR